MPYSLNNKYDLTSRSEEHILLTYFNVDLLFLNTKKSNFYYWLFYVSFLFFLFPFFSLLALSGKNRRTADVRSKGFSTLFSLSKQDFEEIMKNYPQAHELLKKRSQ